MFLYGTILKSYIRHHQCVEKYKAGQLLDKDSFEVDIIESETLSTFHYILGLLPEESAEILKLFSMVGKWRKLLKN